ncbi:MAG: PH domain-containing protein [Acidimicrobiia bacterium]
MPYPESELHASEELILDLHPHWWFFAKSVAGLAVAVVVAVFVLAQGWSWANVPVALFVFGTLVWFVQRYIAWVSTHFVLTSDRVIFRSGIISKHGIEIPLERINTIFFHQRIFERLLGLGDLEIESASKDGAQRFEDIQNPSGVQNEIYQQMEANEVKSARHAADAIVEAQAGTVRPADSGVSIPDQIAQLSKLRDSGALTEEEFQAKKAQLLDRM